MDYSTEEEFINKCSNKENFLVFVSTDWCPNCKFVDAMFVTGKINTDKIIKIDPEATGLIQKLGIDAVPSISKFINGELEEVIVGLIGIEELKETLKSLEPKKGGEAINGTNK